MKTETLLLIAGAVGVGYLIAKKRAKATGRVLDQFDPRLPGGTAESLASLPPVVVIEGPPVYGTPEYVPYPVYGGGWGGGWGGRRRGGHHGGGGGGHGGHHGGHH